MVARFQSVISEETKWQLQEKTGSEDPDYVVPVWAVVVTPRSLLSLLRPTERSTNRRRSGWIRSCFRKISGYHGTRETRHPTWQQVAGDANRRRAGDRTAFYLRWIDYPGIGPLHAHLFDSGRATFYSVTDDEPCNLEYN